MFSPFIVVFVDTDLKFHLIEQIQVERVERPSELLESSAIDQAAKVQRDKAGFLKSTGKEEGMPSSLAE
jgi:hypothetical protein